MAKVSVISHSKRQPLRWLESFPSSQSAIIYTPKQDFMASRILVDAVWDLTGASLTAFQAILKALKMSETSPSTMQTVNGRLAARRILQNANFRTQFTDQLVLNFNLFGNIPAKNQVFATDVLLRDMIFCGAQPFIEWNIGGFVGRLRIAFWVHFERPFLNESAMMFSVKNQNTIRVNMPTLTTTGGTTNLYYTAGVVEQKYLFFEGAQTIQLTAPVGNISIDESNIQSVYLYENANINESAFIETFVNGVAVDTAFPAVARYNSSLDAGEDYPISIDQYTTTPEVLAPASIDFGFIKVFEHPVLNMPTIANKNRNIKVQIGLNSSQNIRYFYTKILETDGARLESESYVQQMQSSFARS